MKNRIEKITHCIIPLRHIYQRILCMLLPVFIWQATHATAWTTNAPGIVTDLTKWTNGVISPTTFATPGDTWTVQHEMTMTSGVPWVVGTTATAPVSVSIAAGATIEGQASNFQMNITVYGNLSVADSIKSEGEACVLRADVRGNFNMTAGALFVNGNTAKLFLTVVGDVTATGGSIYAAGAMSRDTFIVMGDFRTSGTSVISAPDPGSFIAVLLSLPPASGTMFISNTSTAPWGHVRVCLLAGCNAELDGDLTTGTGTIATDILIFGTLTCPAAYYIDGWGTFSVMSGGKIKVAHPFGLPDVLLVTRFFDPGASFEFNGTVPQMIGSIFPSGGLAPPSVVTINNPYGVTYIGGFSTTGAIAFIDGILHIGFLTVPGAAASVTGASATAFVDGWLYKTVAGETNLTFEVGDANYAPMSLSFDAAGVSGTLGVLVTDGLHPFVSTSGLLPSNMVTEYWKVDNGIVSGPSNATMTTGYSYTDVAGGTNVLFMTQKRSATSWLPAPLATNNTPYPYFSSPVAAIPISSLAGEYIFGNDDCGTPPITGTGNLCVGGATSLTNATPGGTWSSGSPSIAPVSGTGLVSGLAAGTSVIFYTASGCTVVYVVTVSTTPNAGVIDGGYTVCKDASVMLSNAVTGGVWSSSSPSVATISSSGVLSGISLGTTTISYTVTDICGVGAASIVVTVTTVPEVLPITGSDSVCVGEIIGLASATPGGTWSSYNTALATVYPTGAVTGISTGIDTIYYQVSNICGSASVKKVIFVKPAGTCLADVRSLAGIVDHPGIRLAPNPNAGTFNLLLPAVHEDAIVLISDITGREVKRFAVLSGDKKEITLTLPPGIYCVSAITDKARYMAKLLIR